MKLPGDRPLFILLTVLVFLHVALRAALVPIIHDEARTFQMYVITGDWLPFQASWDAGNHLLATGLAQLSYPLFGGGLFALRMWSVLAFLLYAPYAWKLGSAIISRPVRWCLWVALLCMPFMLDFFSLFRGYGPAMAFLLMSVFHASRYAGTGSTRDLIGALLAIALASFGSLSLLIMWSAMVAGLGLMTWMHKTTTRQRARSSTWIMILGLAPLIFAAFFSVELAKNGALYFGSDLGLYHGTLSTLSRNVLGTEEAWILSLITFLLITSLVVALLSIRMIERMRPVAVMITCSTLLLGDLIGRIVLGEGFDVLYPTDRTALQLVPLFLILFALVIDHRATRMRALRLLAVLLLVFPIRTIVTANYDRTVYWPEQAIPTSFFDLARERQRSLDRPVMIGAYHQMVYCWNYGAALRGWRSNNPDPVDFPYASCDLLLIDTTFKASPPGYRTIARAATGHNNLMERISPLRTELELDSSFSIPEGNNEFIGLWAPDQRYLEGDELIVEVQAVISSEGALRSDLVLEVSDSLGEHLAYTHYELDIARDAWRNDTMHFAMHLPALDRARARTALYFYNPKRCHYALNTVWLRVHTVLP